MPCRDELRRGCFMWDLRQKACRVRLCELYEFAYELMKSGSFHKNLSKGYFMTKTSSSVYQLPNGMWGYRYAYMFPKFDSMSQHIAERGYLRYSRSVQSLSRSSSTIMEATQRAPASLWWVVSGIFTPFSFVDSE